MSDDPGESFADILNGINGPAPRGPRGERRGLFRRRRTDAPSDGPDAAAPSDEPATGPDSGGTVAPDGYLYGDGAPDGAHSWSGGEPQTAPYGTPQVGPPRHELPEPEPPAERAEDVAIVRPYAWTGGRTRPVYDLAIETLVSVGTAGRDPSRIPQYEHRAVAELCREPRSVAEVAALLTLPLGVARVLIGDMASQGTVVVHQTASTSGDVPDMALMERVLSGLRRL
ncbi:hypothetical protein Acsp06_18660 [Actinomycetospora sp. NBRC 106375]|uniref:DUF742 domain-containing protein n=1 Tax=Actinomycetospora sp. NBRC 106375 TaxID=3032207 RepID=UPI0024A03D3B|nr:DUF742 domain-containing protein [Actinomycetospora sp. NBRC 106375]GLZ45681.1 hypothetical protein Acsp06_18660 [Actinomycetospora sp. NBRC 106375]